MRNQVIFLSHLEHVSSYSELSTQKHRPLTPHKILKITSQSGKKSTLVTQTRQLRGKLAVEHLKELG